MPLTLSVIRANRLPPGQQLSLTLERGSAVIGRAPQSDWVLHDPERIVSGQHCVVEWRENGYYITDTSRNGLYLNQSEERLGHGKAVKLREGDELSLGEYDIRVSIASEPTGKPEAMDLATDVFERSAILSALAGAMDAPVTTPSPGHGEALDTFEPPANVDTLLQSLLAGATGDPPDSDSPERLAAWRVGRQLGMAVNRMLARFEAEPLLQQFHQSPRAHELNEQQIADFRQWLTTLYPEAAREAEEIFWYELHSVFRQASSTDR